MKIKPEILQLYLKRSNWINVESKYKGLSAYVYGLDRNIHIFLPTDFNFKSYDLHVNAAIEVISEVEEKNQDIIRTLIYMVDRDLHNFKIPVPNIESIPLDLVEQVIKSTKKLLELAAKREITDDVRNKFKDLSKAEIIDNHIKSCEFAHTWKGSFGITIENPLGMISVIDEPIPNFERNISKRLFNGVKIIDQAVTNNSVDYIVDNVSKGFDGRMCMQFAEIAEKLNFPSIEYSIGWAPAIKIEDEISSIKKINIDKRSFSFAEKAADKLIEHVDEFETWFNGFPEGLKSAKENILIDEQLGQHFIYVKGSGKDIGYAILKMELNIEDYRLAIKAHEEGKDIRIHCKVKKRIKGWDVLKVMSLKMLE